MYALIAVLSAIIFCLIYGVRILNPTNTDWLMLGTDLTQHYLGWRAYRESAWGVPIGMIDGLCYPDQISVIFTDSIPLLAVPFKLISGVLPAEFQYFGFWGLLCYILQGVMAARILEKYMKNRAVLVMASLLFAFVPVVLQRMYYNSALAGQWILLYGMETLFAEDKSDRKRYQTVFFMALLSASVHMYLVLMSGMILLAICMKDYLANRRFRHSIIMLIEYLVVAATVIAMLGGFSSTVQSTNEGLGEYALNLNGFINPHDAQGRGARILPDLPILCLWADEGYVYLGAGFLFLAGVAIIAVLFDPSVHSRVREHRYTAITVAVLFVISILFALSPRIGLGSHLLLEVPLPGLVCRLWSVFRATGRVAWIAMYLVMIGSIILLFQLKRKRVVAGCMACALLLQIYDLSGILVAKHTKFSQPQVYESALQQEKIWTDIAEQPEIKHIVYEADFNIFEMFYFTDYALDHGMTTSDFYFARSNEESVAIYRQSVLENAPEDTVFVFGKEGRALCEQYHLYCYETKNYIVGYAKALE